MFNGVQLLTRVHFAVSPDSIKDFSMGHSSLESQRVLLWNN
jgi:hypothetical protein